MDGIKISTTQNVELEYEPAGVGYRMLSTLLDSIFMLVYVIVVLFIIGFTSGLRNMIEDYNYLSITLLIIAFLPLMLYHFLSEQFMNGQSFGKKIVGVKVVKIDGTQPGVGSYAIRSLMRIIDVHLINGLIAIISIAVSEKSQRLGDMAAGTTVIKLGAKISLRDTILYKQVSDYKIVFHQVALLADRDIAIIKEIVEYSQANHKPEALDMLTEKVKAKMGITSDLKNEIFLKTVLLDYSHYQFEK